MGSSCDVVRGRECEVASSILPGPSRSGGGQGAGSLSACICNINISSIVIAVATTYFLRSIALITLHLHM